MIIKRLAPMLLRSRLAARLGVSILLAACGGGQDSVLLSLTSQRSAGECVVDIEFKGGAMALYVSDFDLTLLRSNTTPEDGVIYYGLETTDFPEGFSGPLRYGDGMVDRAQVVNSSRVMLSKTYPLPIEASGAQSSLLTTRETCASGTGGCFKVGLVTIPGNAELRIEDFSCEQEARTWETTRYLDPPSQ